MPVYEYRCADCASIFEKLVPMSAGGDQTANDGRTPCPECGGRADKLLSVFASLGGERGPSGGGCCGGGGGGCACAR